MKFKLEFNCDNAAFDNDKVGEIASIIAVTAVRFKDKFRHQELKAALVPVYDNNGNKIGFFKIEGK